MESKENKNENQVKTPSKAKKIVGVIVNILMGIGFISIIYAIVARKYGW